MALQRSRQQTYTIRPPTKGVQGNAFGAEGYELTATIQPMSGTAAAQMYGLQPSQMRLMLFAPDDRVRKDHGVCVDVTPDADPDYRIIYVEQWLKHGRAHLKYIPEGERGADE